MAHDPTAAHLADNIRSLRKQRGLSQVQMAKKAGLPRATWTNLESGSANPTVSVLQRCALALQVPIEELLAAPRSAVCLYRANSLPERSRGGVSVRKLLPERVPGLDIERLVLPAGARMTGVPHTPGTREYLTCERGEIELTASGDKFRLGPGDVVAFRGDQKHGYHNPGKQRAVAYSVIVLTADPQA